MRFSFFISHAAHVAARRASLSRLREQLGDVPVTVIGERLPNHEWSRRMWEAGAASDVVRAVFLQDDDTLCRDFHDRLRELVQRFPDSPISLYQAHPRAHDLQVKGISGIWMPGVLGTGYTMPRQDLARTLAWRASIPPMRVRVGLGEDQILTAYAHVHSRPWLHPIAGLVDHDANVASTNPYPDGFPRASNVAIGPLHLDGPIATDEWLWPGSEKVAADIATALVVSGEMRIFGRTPLQRGPESCSMPVLVDRSIYMRRTGERCMRLHKTFTSPIDADLDLDALCREGAFAVWIEDCNGPIDIFDYNDRVCAWIDATTHYHTGTFAQQMDAAVASLGKST